MDGDEFAARNHAQPPPPAWRRGARGEEAARPPVCSNFHLLLDLNFPGELRDKRSLIKEREEVEEEEEDLYLPSSISKSRTHGNQANRT